MSSFTENYDLIKPSAEDYYDIQDFNENMDAIDTQLAAAEAKMASINTDLAQAEQTLAAINAKIGTPPGGQTVVSLLQNGGSVIRSIQRVTYAAPDATTSTYSIAINPVNPAKTFVISELLRNRYSTMEEWNYSLSSNALTVTHHPVDPKAMQFGFWIVEFV